MVLFPSLMIDLSGILMLQYMTFSRIFEKTLPPNRPLPSSIFFGQKLFKGANIENQSATIAFFFSSSRFLLLVLFFSLSLLSFSFASVISG